MLRNWALALRPSLSLDFLAGLNDSRITYSGGTNGTRVNSSGVIVAATTPRFDYDPVTLAAKGLLVEEARTNVCLRSGDLSNAAWVTLNALTVTSGASDPEGGTNGVTLNDTDAANFAQRIQDIAVANDSTQRTISLFLKQGTAASSAVQIVYFGGSLVFYTVSIDWATKTVTAGGSAGASDVSITPWDDGYYRVSVRGANNSTGNTTMRVSVLPAGASSVTNTGSCIAWGAQAEVGAFATSYIPTTSASVTRTADSAVMTGTNFSSWYNQGEGTFVFGGSRLVAGSAPAVVAFGVSRTGDFNNSMYTFNQTASDMQAYVLVGGGVQALLTSSAASALVPFKYATSYATSNFASCVNGEAVNTDVSGLVPTLIDIFAIGSAPWAPSFNTWNGHIRSIAFYPRRLSNEQLQALTS